MLCEVVNTIYRWTVGHPYKTSILWSRC